MAHSNNKPNNKPNIVLVCPPLCACRASCRSQEVRGARACVVQGCWASGQGDLHGGGAPDLLVLGGWFRAERWVWAGFIWLRPVFPAHGCICTQPANATRTLVLCCTTVESCVAFVECEFAWCVFGVVLGRVFEVCVSTAIASPIIFPFVGWLQVPVIAGGSFVSDCPLAEKYYKYKIHGAGLLAASQIAHFARNTHNRA